MTPIYNYGKRLMDLQTRYYSKMLEKEPRDYLYFPPAGRDEVVTVENRKRGADNYLQFDRIMKCSKPAQPVQAKKLHGTPLFKEPGYFKEESLDIGLKKKLKKLRSQT